MNVRLSTCVTASAGDVPGFRREFRNAPSKSTGSCKDTNA